MTHVPHNQFVPTYTHDVLVTCDHHIHNSSATHVGKLKPVVLASQASQCLPAHLQIAKTTLPLPQPFERTWIVRRDATRSCLYTKYRPRVLHLVKTTQAFRADLINEDILGTQWVFKDSQLKLWSTMP